MFTIAYMCLYSVKKYRRIQAKYAVELEVKQLSSGKRKKGKVKGKKRAVKGRKSKITVMDDSIGAIDMDKTLDQSGLHCLIDEDDLS